MQGARCTGVREAGVTSGDPPMRVTGLRPDRRAPGRLIVEVDGARRASLPVEHVRALGLEVGKALSPEGAERLDAAARADAAYRAALRLLSARPRATRDLGQRLRAKGHPPWAVTEALGRLEVAGLLDDLQFARHFAATRAERGHAPARILADLVRYGVDRKLADRAIAEAIPVDEEALIEQARRLAEKRSRQLGKLPPEVMRRRLLGYLQRRGFGGREAFEAVEGVLGRP